MNECFCYKNYNLKLINLLITNECFIIVIAILILTAVGSCVVSKDKDTKVKSESSDLTSDKDKEGYSIQGGGSGEARLTFHGTYEVPQLKQWFKVNPKPSDHMLKKYAEMLNQGPVRQER